MRPLDSADASLGVTGQPVVIPTGATNGVRSGMEESRKNGPIFSFIKCSWINCSFTERRGDTLF